jgi:hypothetical protein
VGSAVDSIFKSDAVSALDIQINQLDTSSSDHTSGNTTAPPTLFGIIPLGNSFNIPITYGNTSKIAQKLPASSLSDTPTTWASQGVSHLNWTIDLAKGTRFILVAGIGSEQQWASGGSSTMLTVGQGSTGCVGSEQTGGDPAPSITGSSCVDGSSTPSTSTLSLPDLSVDTFHVKFRRSAADPTVARPQQQLCPMTAAALNQYPVGYQEAPRRQSPVLFRWWSRW